MRQMFRAIALAIGLALLAACGNSAATPSPLAAPQMAPAVTNISVSDLKQRLDQKQQFVLLDVRTPEEYTGDGHVAGSRLLPLQDLTSRAGELPKDQPIACICRSGNRSTTACEQLRRLGFTQLLNVEGGMHAWARAGYPIAK